MWRWIRHLRQSLLSASLYAAAPYLPIESIDVLHYDVSLSFPSMESTDIAARATLSLVTREELSRVRLHADASTITISDIWVNDLRARHNFTDGFLEIRLPRHASEGAELTIRLDYVIQAPRPRATEGMIHRVDFHGASVYTTRNWPYFAHRWLPSHDHPSDPASFHMEIAVPPEALAAANGHLTQGTYEDGSGIQSDGLKHFEWDQPTPIPVHAINITVGEMSVITDEICFDPARFLSLDRVPCERAAARVPMVYYLREKHPDAREFVAQAEEGVRQMILMSSVLGPYSLPKLGFVTAPHPINMESASMIVMISPEATTHEVAHQWWGDSLFIEDWGDLWISEGLATYFEGFYEEIRHGRYKACEPTGGVLNHPRETDPLKIFDDTPYCDGAAAIADLRARIETLAQDKHEPDLGLPAFLAVLRGLYQNFEHQPLGTESLVVFLREHTREALRSVGLRVEESCLERELDLWQKRWLAP
jgi:aminopeptidase N